MIALIAFALSEIISHRPHHAEWETRPLSEKEEIIIQEASSQKYRYLSAGAQVYVFLSEDGKYVLKFFKQETYLLPKYMDYLPSFFPYKKKKIESKKRRLERDFESYKLSFDKIQEETGVLLVHLNKTDHWGQVLVVDQEGVEHSVSLDETNFILQEKAEIVSQRMERRMKQGDLEGAKRDISALLGVIATRTSKGVVDRYPNLLKNFGFIGDKAIELDVGRFSCGSKQEGLARLHLEFGAWLQTRYPELVEHWELEQNGVQH